MHINFYLYTINLVSVSHQGNSLKFSGDFFSHISFDVCRLEQLATFDRLQCKLMIMNNRNLLNFLLLLFFQQCIFQEVIDVFKCCHYFSACRGNDRSFLASKSTLRNLTQNCSFHYYPFITRNKNLNDNSFSNVDASHITTLS